MLKIVKSSEKLLTKLNLCVTIMADIKVNYVKDR